jgi:hypothetical protein
MQSASELGWDALDALKFTDEAQVIASLLAA